MEYEKWIMKNEKWNLKYENALACFKVLWHASKCSKMLQSALACFKML